MKTTTEGNFRIYSDPDDTKTIMIKLSDQFQTEVVMTAGTAIDLIQGLIDAVKIVQKGKV